MTDLLATLPDLQNWDALSPWVNDMLARIADADLSQATVTPVIYTPAAHADPVLGVYADPHWRRFALAVFLADWASYTAPADRGDFARVLSVVAAFPAGFRVYVATLGDGTVVPVGYTGWYPITDDIFKLLRNTPDRVTHRGFMVPLKTVSDNGNYIYIFNYSIVPALCGTAQSATLVKDFAAALQNVPYKGLAAVTVSDHGIRVAKKFGMDYTGNMTHDGDVEGVYCLDKAA